MALLCAPPWAGARDSGLSQAQPGPCRILAASLVRQARCLDGACSMTVGKGRSERLILPRFSLGQTTFPLLPIPPFPHLLGGGGHGPLSRWLRCSPQCPHTCTTSCCTSTRSWGPTGLAGRRLGGSDSLCLSLSWFLAPLPLQVSLGLTLPPRGQSSFPLPTEEAREGKRLHSLPPARSVPSPSLSSTSVLLAT